MPEQDKAPETVEIVEPTVVEKVVIDEGTASEGGLNAREIEMGKKHGIIKEPEKVEEVKEKEEESKDKKPDISAEEIRKKQLGDISEEEAVKLSKTEQGYYWQQKKERAKRQTAESDRDFYKMKLNALEDKVNKIEKGFGTDKEKEDEIDKIFDDIDDEVEREETTTKKKTLTKEEWQKEFEREQEEMRVGKQRINAKLNEFESEVKGTVPDLEQVLDLTTDLFTNYKTIYKNDVGKQEEIEEVIKEWTLASADMFKPGARNVTLLAYEIGKTHPNYKPGGKDKAEDNDGEDISDDKMKKLLVNQRGKTSASLVGGSSRVPVSELTLEQAKGLTMSEWRKLPKEAKDRILGKT